MHAATNNRPLVIGAGELLWDLLPAGPQLGGAPVNFAYHAQALGAEALAVSRVGDDPLGREILDRLRSAGLRTDGIGIDPSAPTGTVTVELDSRGNPAFTIHEGVAWDRIEIRADVLAAAARCRAVCFGSLAQREPISRAAILSLVTAAPAAALRIFDINLRQRFYSRDLIAASLGLANVLKLNDEELPVVADLFGLSGDEESLMRRIASQFELQAVALTKGEAGSALLAGEELVRRGGSKLAIADTVGAGDSYTAALAMGLLRKDSPERIIASAHRVADYVCTQHGAMPPLPAEIVAACGGTETTCSRPS